MTIYTGVFVLFLDVKMGHSFRSIPLGDAEDYIITSGKAPSIARTFLR
jgi:hypothetical protein